MVNPYATRQRYGSPAAQLGSKPTTQISLGQSQALKKVETFQRKQQKAELKKLKKEAKSKNSAKSILDTSSSDDSDDESESTSDDTTSDSVLKNLKSNANKFIKNIPSKTKKKSESDDSDNEDDEEDIKDPLEEDESIKESFHYSDQSSNNIAVIPSSNKKPTSSIPSSKQKIVNRVTFEKNVSKKDASQSDITEISSSNVNNNNDNSESGISGVNNLILNINDLDLISDKNSNSNKKKETFSNLKKSNSNERSISEKKDISTVDYDSTNDEDSLSNRNLIFDINDLVTNNKTNLNNNTQNKPPKSEPKKQELKSINKKVRHRRVGSRSHSIVSQDSNADSIATEIINDNIETESIASESFHTVNETSHRVKSVIKNKTESYVSSYQEDFDTESDVSKMQSISRSHIKSSSISVKPKPRQSTASSKSVETQVYDTDLIKNSDLFVESPLFTPFSVSTKKIEWTKYLDLNIANNAFNDLMKMNLDFMRNFINIQRQMYENEMKNLQQLKQN